MARRRRKNRYTVFTDGSANGNGWGAWVALIYKNGKFFAYCAESDPDDPTNNWAELSAIRLAVLELNKHQVDEVVFYSDSQYALGAIGNRKWKIRSNKELINEIRYFVNKLEADIDFQHVPRETPHIKLCDKYANIFRKNNKKISYTKYCAD